MNDEEKKVLELLRMANELMGCILDDKQANIILNLIDKLQKESKESKELYNKLLIGYNKLVQEYLELEKVIDLMATELSRRPLMIYLDDERDDRLAILDNPKKIIKYYTKKVEKENE